MANAAGMFSGVLMTVSLLAVPCVAVFGLPSVGQAVTEASSKEGVSLEMGDELGTPAASQAPPASAFAPLVDAGKAEPAVPALAVSNVAEHPHLDPTSDRRGAVANTAVGLAEPKRTAERIDDAPPARIENVFAIADRPAARGASYESALARLSAYGVRDFRLLDGDAAGEFHFCCSLKDSGRRFTRRFEAEGVTAVAAAEDVLAQVEECLGTR